MRRRKRKKQNKNKKISEVAEEAIEALEKYQQQPKVKEYIPLYIGKTYELYLVKSKPANFYQLIVKGLPTCCFCRKTIDNEAFFHIGLDSEGKAKLGILACEECTRKRNTNPYFRWTDFFGCYEFHEYPVRIKKMGGG